MPVLRTHSIMLIKNLHLKIGLIFIFGFLIALRAVAEDIYKHREWQYLLHIKDGKREVVSDEFYISSQKDPQSEFLEFVKLLNSADGYFLACNFPARYTFVRRKLDVPHFDLSKCPHLPKFIRSFGSIKRVSLAMSSEYLNAPSSAFGHIMLVFHDTTGHSLESDAIHFAAFLDHQDGFITYAYKGLTGKYDAHFIREPLFKRINLYSYLEQRYVHFHQLDLTQAQIKYLIFHLYELRKSTFKYYFLKENCAYQIDFLISLVTNKERHQSFIYTLPIDIVQRHKAMYLETIKVDPLWSQAKRSIDSLSDAERLRFHKIVSQEAGISEMESNKLRQSLYYYYQYNFRKNRIVFKNYYEVVRTPFEKEELPRDNTSPPLEKTFARKVGISYGIMNGRSFPFLLSVRPASLDIYDLQMNSLHESELLILDSQISLGMKGVRIEEIKFLTAKLFTDYSEFFKSLSWEIYSGLNRKNTSEQLFFSNEFGLGQTFSLKWRLSLNYLLGVGLDYNFKMLKPFLSPSVALLFYFDESLKVGYMGKYKRHISEDYLGNELFVSKKLGHVIIGSQFVLFRESKYNQLFVSLQYNY